MANSSGFVSYFGTELRRHRERLGRHRDELADRVPWSVWTITSVEQGRRKPPPGFGEHADALFNLPGVMTALTKKAQGDRTPFGDRIELEQRADSIYEYDLRVVPGLLQTEGYARAVNLGVAARHVGRDDPGVCGGGVTNMHEWRKSAYSTQGESNCVEVCDVVLREVGDGVEGGSA